MSRKLSMADAWLQIANRGQVVILHHYKHFRLISVITDAAHLCTIESLERIGSRTCPMLFYLNKKAQ